MVFVYHKNAGDKTIVIDGQTYIHLYKSRRSKKTQNMKFRNLKDNMIHTYNQIKIDKKSATLELVDSLDLPLLPKRKIHIILAITQEKTLEKILPMLNEFGVGKLTLFWSDFTQGQEDLQRWENILINSSQQCGRSNTMEIEKIKTIGEVVRKYPNSFVFDFGGEKMEGVSLENGIIIGPQGGFSPKEREILKSHKKYSNGEEIILKSESACAYVSARAL